MDFIKGVIDVLKSMGLTINDIFAIIFIIAISNVVKIFFKRKSPESRAAVSVKKIKSIERFIPFIPLVLGMILAIYGSFGKCFNLDYYIPHALAYAGISSLAYTIYDKLTKKDMQ